MVLNKRDLERAFSPSKSRKKRRSIVPKSDAESSANVRVVVRIRPENARELQQSGSRSVIKVVDENTLIFDPKEESPEFFYHGVQQVRRDLLKKQNKEVECIFDQVFDRNNTNQEVFDGSTKDMITSLLDGYNCSVFAYGATGAGKTFTMLGNNECPGITYLTMAELYKQIDELKEDKDFELGISHLEVYNENVQDLIEPSGPLHLRDDGNAGVLVAGLSIHRIQNAEELLALLERGNKNRTQHPTDANAESSRSHAVFQVYIRMISKHSKQTKIVKLSMIDLAGSERGSATGCKGVRFTEGANINRSLLALGNCINNLADGLKHIPYRDSKLTRLLKDSLGGNCRTVMIANVSPSSLSYEDTYNTLKYALRAKKIRSTLKKNIVSIQLHGARYAKLVEELSTQVETLKGKLKEYETKLKEYESNNEVKPGTSRTVDPPVIKVPEKCKDLLALLETKRAMHKEIWKLGKELKTLKWRIKQKFNTARGLPDLYINALEMNKGLNRIKTSVSQFEGRAASIREKMQKALSNLKTQIQTEVVLSSELEQDGSLSTIAKDIEMHKLILEKEEKSLQIEHLQLLLSMQQSENESQFKIIRELSTTLREYHFTLIGHDRMTGTMNSHYQRLVRMLEGVKTVSWQEDQNSEDPTCLLNMKDFCDLSIKSLDKETKQTEISSKLFEELSANFSKQFSLSSVLVAPCTQSQTSSQGSILDNTTAIVTSSPVKDSESSKGLASHTQLEVAFELPINFQIPKLPALDSTFSKPKSENEVPEPASEKVINPEVLNSTFEIKMSPRKPTPPEGKTRVLKDHNRLQPNILRPGVTNGLQNTKKRTTGISPQITKVLCNKENREVFAKPKLPMAPRSSKLTPLGKPNLATNSNTKLPLNRNVQNIARLHNIPKPLNNPIPASPRFVRTPQKQFKHDWRKIPSDRRRSQSLRMKPYSTPNKFKTG